MLLDEPGLKCVLMTNLKSLSVLPFFFLLYFYRQYRTLLNPLTGNHFLQFVVGDKRCASKFQFDQDRGLNSGMKNQQGRCFFLSKKNNFILFMEMISKAYFCTCYPVET